MSYSFRLVATLVLGVAVAACTPGDVKDDQAPVVEDKSAGAAGQAGADQGASTSALPGAGKFTGDPLDDPASPLVKRVIYFEFDQSDIKPEMQELIIAHGDYLAAHPGTNIVLEGHADERGSREYNIGLGDRRAQAVRRLLLFRGAADQQIQVVSYGEEKPADPAHDEAAWVQNRRVEIVYKR